MAKCQLTGNDCDHPLCQPFLIPREIGNELYNDLYNLMCSHYMNPNSSDYLCSFCGEYENTSQQIIMHKDNCLGNKLISILIKQM